MSDALANFVRRVMGFTLYHARYDCVVQRQHEDDSLDLLPDDERIRGDGLSSVPIRHGLPGVRCRVAIGSRVLLGFEAGDRRRPYAHLWQLGSIEELSFDGGQAPIARQGDAVRVVWPTVDVTGFAPGGVTFHGTIAPGTVTAGVIETGAKRVKA